MKKFNNWLAEKITALVGTMWTAYAFTILSLVSLPAALNTHDPIIIIAWIAQTFLQLVLLPIIIVGQNLQAERHEQHANKLEEIHNDIRDKDGFTVIR